MYELQSKGTTPTTFYNPRQNSQRSGDADSGEYATAEFEVSDRSLSSDLSILETQYCFSTLNT